MGIIIRFEEVIGTRDRLREIVKEPSRLVAHKAIDHVDDFCRSFMAALHPPSR